jgi:lysine decarboxylase
MTPPALRLVPTTTTPGDDAGEMPPVDPRLALDVPRLTGVDDTHGSRHALERAERLAAEAFAADWTRFSAQGPTHPNQAMLMAVGSPGDEVVIARTSHTSTFLGLVQSGLRPVWLTPDVDPATGLSLALPASRVATMLREHPMARAVVLVEPSAVGLCSDVETIAEAAHARRIPLLVDQAGGAHFGFHPSLPRTATRRGADAVSTSMHTTVPDFTQGSMLHARDRGYLDLERLAAAFDGLMTTSPSGTILASLDRARALMQRDGQRLLGRALALADRFREAIHGFEGARCFGLPALLHPAVSDRDPLKLIVDLGETGADGFDVEDDLEREGVRLELVDRRTLVPILTVGDDDVSVGRLIAALRRALRRRAGTARTAAAPATSWRVAPEQALTPREAFLASRERVPVAAAVGRIAAELVAPSPPGIPALAPGEVVTRPLLAALLEEARAGSRIAGASDPSLETLLVVARR